MKRLTGHCQIYGQTQTGKTYLALKILQNQPANGIKIVINTKGEVRYNKSYNVILRQDFASNYDLLKQFFRVNQRLLLD